MAAIVEAKLIGGPLDGQVWNLQPSRQVPTHIYFAIPPGFPSGWYPCSREIVEAYRPRHCRYVLLIEPTFDADFRYRYRHVE